MVDGVVVHLVYVVKREMDLSRWLDRKRVTDAVDEA